MYLLYHCIFISKQVTITYSSGRKTRALPKDLNKLGKALARGSDPRSIVAAMSSSPKLRDSFEEHMCNTIRSEVKTLCSVKSPSCLRTPTKETMLAFSWSKVAEEIRGKAPLLQKVLETVSNPKLTKDTTRFPGLCLAA